MAASDSKATPLWGVAHRITFPILDATGNLVTGATTPDSEISKDGGTFTDCTNEATEIATASGMYYLDLTATEMEADQIAVIIKSGNGKTTVVVLYPERGTRTRKAQAGAAGTITLDASAVATDDYYNDQVVVIVGGTGVGQARLISDYVGSSKVASVVPNWATNPSTDSIFQIIPAGRVDVGQWLDAAPNALVSGRMDSDVGNVQAGAVNQINQAVGGTADAGGSTTTIVDAERTEADPDYWKGSYVLITSGSAIGQIRRITGFNATTDTITVSPAFTQSIGAGVTYIILRNAAAEVLVDAIKAGAVDAAAVATDAIDGDALAASAVAEIQSGLALSTQVDAVEADLDDIQTRLPATLSGGKMRSQVEGLDADVITAASIAAGAIGVAEAPNLDAAISSRAAPGAAMALTPGERDSVAAALLDLANGCEAGYTVRQTLRIMAAVLAGKASGGPSGSTFRNLPDTANRVAATADANGDRSAMVHTP